MSDPDLHTGLGSAEAAALARFGPNVPAPRRRLLIVEFLARFGNPLVILLLAASALSALTGEVTSFVILPHVLRPAARPSRRRGRLPHGLVRRVARHAGAGHLRHPDP